MNLITAQSILFNDIKAILEGAGLKNGLGADKSGVLYYQAHKQSVVPNADTFVVYDLYLTQPLGRADEKVLSYDSAIAVDVYTKLDRTSKVILDLLCSIEIEAHKMGYDMEFRAQDSFDNDNQLNHLSYDLHKRLKEE